MVLFIQCIVLCIIFTLIILPPQLKNPLSQIVSYPPAIRDRVASLPQYKDVLDVAKKKNITRKIVGTLVAVVALAFLAFFSGKTTFTEAFIHVFILLLAVNLHDLLILDCIVFAYSKKVVIPGTEDMVKEYKNPIHHIKGACKGVVIGAAAAALAAGIVMVMSIVFPSTISIGTVRLLSGNSEFEPYENFAYALKDGLAADGAGKSLSDIVDILDPIHIPFKGDYQIAIDGKPISSRFTLYRHTESDWVKVYINSDTIEYPYYPGEYILSAVLTWGREDHYIGIHYCFKLVIAAM